MGVACVMCVTPIFFQSFACAITESVRNSYICS